MSKELTPLTDSEIAEIIITVHGELPENTQEILRMARLIELKHGILQSYDK
jgi:hypothetical protein